MATGFMANFIALWLLTASTLAAHAADIALIGVIGETAAVIALDGGEPKTVKLGQTWSGIKVIAVERTRATIEFEGKQRVLSLGQHYRSSAALAPNSASKVTLAADGRGMGDTEELHRIDPATVRKQVEAAGFRFAGESKVLENASDPLNIPVFDKAIRGRTSQFAFKFVKPAD